MRSTWTRRSPTDPKLRAGGQDSPSNSDVTFTPVHRHHRRRGLRSSWRIRGLRRPPVDSSARSCAPPSRRVDAASVRRVRRAGARRRRPARRADAATDSRRVRRPGGRRRARARGFARAIERDALSSLILYGPAGTGQDVARAHHRRRHAGALRGGLGGHRRASPTCARRSTRPATVSACPDSARSCSSTRSTASRKSQQDALLHAVEDRLVVLIGATTENPFFEVNAPLDQPLAHHRARRRCPTTTSARSCGARWPTSAASAAACRLDRRGRERDRDHRRRRRARRADDARARGRVRLGRRADGVQASRSTHVREATSDAHAALRQGRATSTTTSSRRSSSRCAAATPTPRSTGSRG